MKRLIKSISAILEREVMSDFPPASEIVRDDYTLQYLNIPSKVDINLSSSVDRTEITLLLKPALCKTCNKLLSRRFDAVIQLRTIKTKSQKPKDLLESSN